MTAACRASLEEQGEEEGGNLYYSVIIAANETAREEKRFPCETPAAASQACRREQRQAWPVWFALPGLCLSLLPGPCRLA